MNTCDIAEKFRCINAHDDTVEGFEFVPAKNRRSAAKVVVTLFRHWQNRRYQVVFSGCANFQVVLDADVLLGNAPNNTACFDASTDVAALEKLVRRHRQMWNVTYQKSIDPLALKLAALDNLLLFKVNMFGGVLQIAARNFSIRRVAR